ncbi:MAG: DUF92 domain-containing protein [Chloroflexi bacterium]|nr:DUF92 domain-containing protein [Chloroflexota bacterium]
MLIALVLAALVAGAAWRFGALDRSGWLAATLLGGWVYGMGGLSWAVLLLAFFGSASLLSRLFARRKAGVAAQFAKGGRRDWAQVAANGGLGALFLGAAALGWIGKSTAWLGYAVGLATVTADTWATEVGVLSRKRPRLITTWRKVPPGTSGGLSLLGTGATLLGGGLIGLLAAWMQTDMKSGSVFGLVALGGLLGSLADSWMGATVQASYYCPTCEKETERHPLHSCGTQTEWRRGWRWLSNDWVNFLSALIAAGLVLGLAALFGGVG